MPHAEKAICLELKHEDDRYAYVSNSDDSPESP